VHTRSKSGNKLNREAGEFSTTHAISKDCTLPAKAQVVVKRKEVRRGDRVGCKKNTYSSLPPSG